MEQSIICRKAIETWGPEHQRLIAIEECSELINALAKYPRGRVSDDEIIEEIADVQVCCEQLAQMFGREKVAKVRYSKLRRLLVRIHQGFELFV